MNNNNNKTLISTTFTIAIIVVSGKIISFVRDILIARNYGATELSDVFVTSITITLVLTSVFKSALGIVYLPKAVVQTRENERCSFFTSSYFYAVIFGFIFALLELLFINQIITVLVPGFSSEAKKLIRELVLIQLPVIVVSFVDVISCSNLKIQNDYAISELGIIIPTILMSIYLVVYGENSNILILAILNCAGYCATTVIQYIRVSKNEFKVHFCKNNISLKTIRPIFIAMLPLLLSTGAREINILVDKMFASMLDTGSITMMSYASKISTTEVSIISTAASMTVFTFLAKCNANGENERVREIFDDGMLLILTLLLPLSIFTIGARKEIVEILFGHGKFTSTSIDATSKLLGIYALSIVPIGIQDVLFRALYSLQKNKYPIASSIIMVIINIVLNVLLFNRYGMYGLAAATVIAVASTVLVLLAYSTKKLLPKHRKQYSNRKSYCALAVASIVITFETVLLHAAIPVELNTYFKILIMAIVILVTYVAISWIMQNKIIRNIVSRRESDE